MATDTTVYRRPTEVELLYRFLGEQLQNGGREKPLAALLRDFSAYAKETFEVIDALDEGMADLAAGRTISLEEFDAEMRRKYSFLKEKA